MITHSMMAFVIWSCICLAVAFIFLIAGRKKTLFDPRRLPPRPPGWPLFGNIFDLGSEMPHHSLANLSRKYGPIMWLQFGSLNTVVVSTAEVAMDMFKNHDLAFANRNINEAMRANTSDHGPMSLAEYGPYWRTVRRLCTTKLFTHNRIIETEHIRKRCIEKMMTWMWDETQEKGSVEITRLVSFMTFNITSNLLFSKDLVDPQSKEGSDFLISLARAIVSVAKPNVADFFPFLRWLDPQGIQKNLKRDMRQTYDYTSNFVKERLLEQQNGRKNNKEDLLDVMLAFEGDQKVGEPSKLSVIDITVIFVELFTGFADTTTSTLEWALAELLRNPGVMKKLKVELDEIIGQNKKIEECDIENLHYLQAVVKETLRLHPPAPLLMPRKSREDTLFMGYTIPKDTQILVNVWAIGRDPVSWEDPLSFKPERFFDSDVDFRGNHFQLLPFGAGRRMCPGMPMAQRTLPFVLGTLIQSFEWALEDGVTPENMDMNEMFGIALRKAEPLKAVLKLRPIQKIVITS